MNETQDQRLLTVTDLKQMSYCARVTYYEHCLPHIRPRTYKMDAGHDAHEAERRRAARRNLSSYGLLTGRRRFDVILTSSRLGLTGVVDEVVTTPDGSQFPVDYKLAKAAQANYRLQLTAYALLLEESGAPHVQQGYVYLIPPRRLITVPISEALRESVLKQVSEMQEMIARERMPEPTQARSRCTACEFRRFCNDI